jgi:hypothetical protein
LRAPWMRRPSAARRGDGRQRDFRGDKLEPNSIADIRQQ